MITEYKFINGFPDNIEKRMMELSKDGWYVERIDMSRDIIKVLLARYTSEANPPDHPSVSSLG